ncbi:hypothetical protein [Chryseobacterium sp. H1D6B]|uniref:helix-turn-helix transcriptional regulator n=1 Tax=Chryseobacterium sp. H1D6B TaxID=2940588 RepID=UPI0015C7354F|nr:hypothetical protein [Chryseobacterium sp. H1D6B]
MRKLSVLFLLSFSSYLFSQKTSVRNLENIISKSYFTGNMSNENTIVQLTELYYLSKNEGYIPGQISSLYEQARLFCDQGKFKKSLEKIAEGIHLAQQQEDYNMLCRLLLVYQKNLIRLDKPLNSKNMLAKSEEYNKLNTLPADKQINDIYILLAKARLMVDAENITKDMSPVINLKRQAYSEALKIDNSNKYKKYTVIFTLESLAWTLALSRKTSEADQLTKKIDELLKSYPDEHLLIENFVIKGAVNNLAGDYKTGLKYLFMAKDESIKREDSYRLYEIYPSISAAFGQIGDFKKSTYYSWGYNKLADSLTLEKGKIDENFIHTINAAVAQKKDNNLPIVIISLIGIFAGILFFVIRKYRNYLGGKRKINSLQNSDNAVSSDIEIENTKRLIKLAKEDINAFYVEFNKIYPHFYQSLKEQFSELNMADIRFCSLIKMNFEIKEIAAYTNTSIRSVESRRYRILKKMELKNQDELYVILSKVH